MILGSRRRRSQTNVVIITGSCCIPGMAPFDEQAQRVVEQAISETGVAAQARVIPASNAMFGAVPMKVMKTLMAESNAGRMPLPAVLIDGAVVSYGVPTVDDFKSALVKAAAIEGGDR